MRGVCGYEAAATTPTHMQKWYRKDTVWCLKMTVLEERNKRIIILIIASLENIKKERQSNR